MVRSAATPRVSNHEAISTRLVAPIEPRARVLDLGLMICGPFAQRFHRLPQPTATMRLISLKRRGPLPSSMMTNTLHLSPTRASIEATPRQSLSRCALGGRTGTLMCSGFNGVLRLQKCAFLRELRAVTHIVSVTNLYQG